MSTSLQEYDPAFGRVIQLRSLGATLRRRWRVWVILGLVGLVLGASLHLVVPRKYSAISDLYLAIPSGSNPAEVMANNVALLQTDAVAKQAISLGRLDTTPHALLTHSSALAVSDDIMSITFSATSPAQAVAGSKALARGFLTVQAGEVRRQTNGLVTSLRSQISSLNTSVGALNSQIDNQSNASASTTPNNTLSNLINQRTDDESQISQLDGQIGQALTEEQSFNATSHLLDPAAVVPVSGKKVVIVDGLSGLVAGLAIGLAAVLLGGLSERAPDRGTVAETLGAPVALCLERHRRPRLMRRRRLAQLLRTPDPAIRMIERRLRAQLESAPGSALLVVTMGPPELAALGVGALAQDLSSEGRRVLVVDAADNRPLASILGLPPTSSGMEMFPLQAADGRSTLRLVVAPPDPIQMAEKPPPDDTDALLILAVLDPAFGAEHLAPWASDAVAVLSTRSVSLARMDVGREMLCQAGISLRSVILLDSDAEDETSGVLSPGDLLLTPGPDAAWPK